MTRLAALMPAWAALRRPTGTGWSWGWFPPLAVIATSGVLLVAAANRGGLAGAFWADGVFFAGLLLIVLPIALRLLMVSPHGTERMSLVALLAMALYLCKFLRDPLLAGGFDEYLHLRTAQDIIATGTLFEPNTLLQVSPYYPGLELATTSIAQMAGIGTYEAGVLLLAAARLVFLLSLFFFFAMASGSARIAGIASLIYMLNPRFLYFDAQFAYETLGLPLAALALYLLARRGHSGPAHWAGVTVILGVALAAVVTTHHVTSVMLSSFIVLWALTGIVRRRRERARPGRVAATAVALTVGWTLLVATATIDYLIPVLGATFNETLRLLTGELDPRQLFVSRGGAIAPLWERLVGSASTAVVLLLLPLGLLIAWARYRTNPLVVTLAVVAIAYPLTLLARFTTVGAEAASRMPEFLFLGIGLVIALGLARFPYRGRLGRVQLGAAGVLLAVLTLGGVLTGMPPWARLPGPYLVSADGRSVEVEGIAAASWARSALGSDNRFVADRINRILFATYGDQHLITTYGTGVPVRRLYLSPRIDAAERDIVRRGQLDYLVVDRRLTTALPVVGHYFDRGEEAVVGRYVTPLDAALLDKFDQLPDASRVFDSGNIQIYDISGLAAGD
ncbi:MAG TPA: hypothetical protein VH741_08935 [Candidatus Limnocylindrales bacterium]